MSDLDDIPSMARYAGGQECPGCERAVSLAARYCQWCGTCLDTGLYERALDEWGFEAQANMAIQEAAELQKALTDLYFGRADDAAVVDEIADVQIMADQLALHFGEDEVRETIEQKRERLTERLEAETDE